MAKGKDQSVPGSSSAARGAAAMPLLEQQHRGALRDQGEVQVQVTVSVTTGKGSGDSKETKNYVVEEASGPYPASQPAGAELPGVQRGFEGIDRWKNFLHQETEQPSQKPEPTAEESMGPLWMVGEASLEVEEALLSSASFYIARGWGSSWPPTGDGQVPGRWN